MRANVQCDQDGENTLAVFAPKDYEVNPQEIRATVKCVNNQAELKINMLGCLEYTTNVNTDSDFDLFVAYNEADAKQKIDAMADYGKGGAHGSVFVNGKKLPKPKPLSCEKVRVKCSC